MDIIRDRADKRGKISQYSRDLTSFLQSQLPPLVAQLHRGERLDEYGRAGVGSVVNYARNATSPVRTHRHYQPVAPDRDDRVLEGVLPGWGADEVLERTGDPFVRYSDLSAERPEAWRRVVVNFTAFADLGAYLARDSPQVRDYPGEVGHYWSRLRGAKHRGPRAAVYFERIRDGQEIIACQDASQRCASNRLGGVGVRLERQVSKLVQEGTSVGGLPLKTLHLERIERRGDLQSQYTGFVEGGVVGEALPNVVKVQQTH